MSRVHARRGFQLPTDGAPPQSWVSIPFLQRVVKNAPGDVSMNAGLSLDNHRYQQ
jgi:hypothetical protein